MSENGIWCLVLDRPSNEVIKEEKCIFCWWCSANMPVNTQDNK